MKCDDCKNKRKCESCGDPIIESCQCYCHKMGKDEVFLSERMPCCPCRSIEIPYYPNSKSVEVICLCKDHK